MFVLLAANIAQAGKVFDIFWADASRTSYLLQGLISILYVAIAIGKGEVLIALAAGAIVTYLALAHLVFVFNAGVRANFNAIVTYFPLLTFSAFAISNCSMRHILRMMLLICLAYTIFYIAINSYIMSDPIGHASVILIGHGEDSGRVYLAAAYPAFVALYALRARRVNFLARLLLVGVSVLAIWMSGSRAFTAALALVFAIGAVRHMNVAVRFTLLVTVLGAMIVILAGIVWVGWNPFSWLAFDTSGTYRAFEYEYAVKAIRAHWMLGVGTPTTLADLQHYLGTPKYSPLFASDLGIIAPIFEFGVSGLVIFVAVTCFCMMAPVESKGPEFQALKLVCITCASYAIISPLLLLEPASIFVMLLIALRIREGHRDVATVTAKGAWFFHIAEE